VVCLLLDHLGHAESGGTLRESLKVGHAYEEHDDIVSTAFRPGQAR